MESSTTNRTNRIEHLTIASEHSFDEVREKLSPPSRLSTSDSMAFFGRAIESVASRCSRPCPRCRFLLQRTTARY